MEKILIAEVSDNTIWYKFFPYYANVWMVRTNNIYSDIAASDFELENIGLYSELIVISLQVNKIPYLKVDTVSEVITSSSTFYYDITTKTLLVHFENHKPYYYFDEKDIEIGFVLGFYLTNSSCPGVWNNVQYYPRLLSNPVFEDSKDDPYYGKQKLQGAEVEIDNHDLRFKGFNVGPGVVKRNGNYVRTLIWTGEDADNADYNDFIVTYQGIIEKITEGKKLKIELRDIRSSLDAESPTRYLDTSWFPYIKDPDKKYTLPETWGKCYSIPLLCLNENVNDGGGSTAYQFLICDTNDHTIASNSVQKVYINNKETSLTPTVLFDTNQGLAYIEIAAINFSYDNGISTRYENMDKVTIDVYGYLKGSEFRESNGSLTSSPTDLIENSLAIIREILRKNYGYTYIPTFYDITNWQTFEESSYAYSIGYYLNNPLSTQKQIEEIVASVLGKFEWDANRRFSFKSYDYSSFILDILKTKFLPLDYFIEVSSDSTVVLSKVRVGYKKRYSITSEEYKYEEIIDDTNSDTALYSYNSKKQEQFKTLINNQTDAEDFASRILAINGISKDIVNIALPFEYFFTLKSGEWIMVQLDYINEVYLGWSKCQIQSIKPNIESWTVDIELRIFGYYTYITDSTDTYKITDKYGRFIIKPYGV